MASMLLVLQTAASPAQQQAPKAGIEGVVFRLGTGEPVTGARVTLIPQWRPGLGGPGGTAGPAGTMTPEQMAMFGAAGPNAAGPGTSPASLQGPQGGPQGTPGPGSQTAPLVQGVQGGRGAPAAPPPAAIPAIVTDDKGKFAFQELEAGGYMLNILANGYVGQTYGQRYANGPGTAITLTAGQERKDLAVTLTPAGNISGRIRDREDRPLMDVPVQLLRGSYNAQGQRTYQSAGTARTDDRGDYRLYWVTPGRYYLMAGSATIANPMLAIIAMELGGGGNANQANRVPIAMGYAFYPGVTDIGSAHPLELQAGAELAAMNMTLTAKPQTFRIRGRVVDSRTGMPPQKATVVASAQTPGLASNEMFDAAMIGGLPNQNYNAATGAIEIRDLLPGIYAVTASAQDPPPAAAAGERGGRGAEGGGVAGAAVPRPGPSTGMTTVVVSDEDVEGVVVTVVPPVSIPGRLRVDGQLPAPLTIERLRVQLIRRNPAASRASRISASGGQTSVKADGTFRIDNVASGEYRLAVLGTGGSGAGGRPGGGAIYVKEARFEGNDAVNTALNISGSVSGGLEIVVGVGGGQISGVVADERSQPVAVAQVALVPDRARDRAELFKTATTDDNGRFVFAGIEPGEYKVFSWEGLEPYGWFDPDLLALSETKGRAVRVADGSTETIDVKIIAKDGAP